MLHTNGKHLLLNAFDLKHQWGEQVWIPSLSKCFPDAESILQWYCGKHVVTAGIDPGEHVTAHFCALDPDKPHHVNNLPAH